MEGDVAVSFLDPVMMDAEDATRLFLIAPPRIDAIEFMPRLVNALDAAHVAAVLFALQDVDEQVLTSLVDIVQQAGAAALVAGDTRLAGHVKADGVHIGGDLEDVRFAVESFKPKRIVGVGNLYSRHAALEVGELDVDYLFFGRPYGDTRDTPHPKALELAEWWSEVTAVPAVVMAGRSLESIRDAAATGAEFVALQEAVWSHPGGPGEAVKLAAGMLARAGRWAA